MVVGAVKVEYFMEKEAIVVRAYVLIGTGTFAIYQELDGVALLVDLYKKGEIT